MIEKTILLSKLTSIYGGLLTDKQKDALELYYNCDMSLAEIGDELSISRQGVRDTVTRAEKTLLEAEQKLGFLKKSDELVARLSEISDSLTGEQKNALLALIKELED